MVGLTVCAKSGMSHHRPLVLEKKSLVILGMMVEQKVCKHKNRFLTCKDCKMQCCSGCIQSEAHSCPMLKTRILAAREELMKKLPKVEAPKLVKI